MTAADLRIATFNLENLGSDAPDGPGPAACIRALRPMLVRLEADVLCLQEVNGNRPAGESARRLDALAALLADTAYADWSRVATTGPSGRGPMDVHNLVIVSRLPVVEHRQYRHDLVAPPVYAPRNAPPRASESADVPWDRPLLHTRLRPPSGPDLHVINVHLRAPLAVALAGQKQGPFAWRSTAAWAEGFFLAAIKRAGQALEARFLVDALFDAEPEPRIVVVGDFNADAQEVPVRIVLGAERTPATGIWRSGRLSRSSARSRPRGGFPCCTTARRKCSTTSWSRAL